MDHLRSILEFSISVLEDLCNTIAIQLKDGVASRSLAREQLFRRLKTLSVLAGTPSQEQLPRFPGLVHAIGDILKGKTLVEPVSYRYIIIWCRTTCFTRSSRDTRDNFELLLREANRNLPDDADIELALSRLTAFNEPATTILSYNETQACYWTESVFSQIEAQDFYQLGVFCGFPNRSV